MDICDKKDVFYQQDKQPVNRAAFLAEIILEIPAVFILCAK
jgi:hypothetical protein